MEFRFEVTLIIEADTVEEAEREYRRGDWEIDGHAIFVYDEEGNEIEVEVPDLEEGK